MSNTVDKQASLHGLEGETLDRVAVQVQPLDERQTPTATARNAGTDLTSYSALDLGGRERGAWHGDGQSIAPPRPVIEDAPRTERQAAAAWGHEQPNPAQDRVPNDRALDLVDAAGTGGYILAVMQAGVGGAPTGTYHLALLDTNGAVAPELLANEQGRALTYPSAEAASADRDRLFELAAERELEHALEDERGFAHGLTR